MAFNFLFLIAAFGGGVFGAAIGGLASFIFCGFAAIVGAGIMLATGDGTFSGLVAWGPFLGPQIAFAGGAAAAVYAAKQGKLANGRDIATALMGLDSPDVLLVGGVFGVLGYILWWLFAQPQLGVMGLTNPIALSIVVNAIIARLLFGKTGVFGKVRKGDNRWLASDVGNWIPWQSKPLQLLVIGLGLGIVATWSTLQNPAAAGLWFGFAAASLILLQLGFKVPVWHHIVLAAEQVVAVAGGDLGWGIAFAVLGAFLGEFYAMLFTAHGDSHIDPPSVSLFTTFTLMAILKYVGAFNITGVGSLIIAAVVAAAGYAVMAALKSKPNAAVAPAGAKA